MKKQKHLLSQLYNHGQVAVVVILIAAVLIIVGLSLASRTTREVSLGTQSKESSVVLSAAETGAERAINDVLEILDAGGNFPEAVTEEFIATTSGTEVLVNYSITPQDYIEVKVPAGKEIMVDLRDPDTGEPAYNGDLEVKWAKESVCEDRASLIITRYFLSGGQLHSDYQAVGPTCVDRNDKFMPAGDSSVDDYNHIFTVSGLTADANTGDGDLFVTLKPIYHETDLMVNGDGDLPRAQQYVIESRGVNQTGETNETRAIRIDYTLPVPPYVLNYAAYSGNTLAK